MWTACFGKTKSLLCESAVFMSVSLASTQSCADPRGTVNEDWFFACMYESLPDISPEASCILIASHLPYVFSICLSLHPCLHHLVPLRRMELRLPRIQQQSHLKFHIRVFLAGYRQSSERRIGLVCRNSSVIY